MGYATVRAILMKSRDQRTFYYTNSGWSNPLLVGTYLFLQQPGVRSLDSRSASYYYFTGSTPGMSMIGKGSQ